MELLTKKQAVAYLQKRVIFNDPSKEVNLELLKELADTNRMSPKINTIFKKRYTKEQLRTYVHDVMM